MTEWSDWFSPNVLPKVGYYIQVEYYIPLEGGHVVYEGTVTSSFIHGTSIIIIVKPDPPLIYSYYPPLKWRYRIPRGMQQINEAMKNVDKSKAYS